MSGKLSAEQIEGFQRDGFVTSLSAFTTEKAACYRRCLEDFEASQGAPLTELGIFYQYKMHLLYGWASEVVRQPAVLDAVESLIGPDILIFTARFFIKEPGSPGITAWHQDATHFGFAEPETVAAWVAFTDAPAESGCIEFARGSHKLGQLQHRSKVHADSISGSGQTIVASFDESNPVAAPLRAGEFSLHHSLSAHRSQRNESADRRIGLSIHYVSPRAGHLGSRRISATLVRGEDKGGNYDLEPSPSVDFDDAARAAHEEAFQRYRANYAEQEERHAAAEGQEGAS